MDFDLFLKSGSNSSLCSHYSLQLFSRICTGMLVVFTTTHMGYESKFGFFTDFFLYTSRCMPLTWILLKVIVQCSVSHTYLLIFGHYGCFIVWLLQITLPCARQETLSLFSGQPHCLAQWFFVAHTQIQGQPASTNASFSSRRDSALAEGGLQWENMVSLQHAEIV